MSHPEVKYMAHDTAIATNEFLTGIAFLIEARKYNGGLLQKSNGLVTPWILREHINSFHESKVTPGHIHRRYRLGMETVSILTNMGYRCIPVPGGAGSVDIPLRIQKSLKGAARAAKR